jgi:esterase/lipase superfamily enzyme
MALQKDITKTQTGFTGSLVAQDVYFKVVSVSGSKESMQALVTGMCNGSAIFNESYSFTPDLSGANFIAQAYQHLKTLPEFASAKDV